jgi:hypothetical protein
VDKDRILTYVSTKEIIVRDTVMVVGSVALTFIAAYLALNLT